ncbi:phosphoenolpyruvate mutase [Magnetospirillum sp. XM-1]|uniref:phosphoenolpyruvate mutase n=1 Tax=Magnetospirillum sp. XM-1 TaxID=1663591 RepID=UPI001E425852|nr:phosphoenolpyruvate mutase [Magnetospirillum sp. XM-1]
MVGNVSRSGRFRQMLAQPSASFLMEAHNGLSARIVEQAGFEGIWASGLSIATSLGLRDCNEASWTQVLDIVEYMADATSIPIVVDGDTGYGNFNNARMLVRKLCQRHVAAVCLEDKIFPKTNSFIGEEQELADVAEFCGKIAACKDSQSDPNFSVIARVEALIAGKGVNEALDRAHAYAEAGADAILIHSKKADPAEILEFADRWHHQRPLVVVPTMYYRTPTEVFEKAGVSLVIWANHNMRAAIVAMRETCRHIATTRSLVGIEEKLPTVKDVFNLMNYDELFEAERRYLPGGEPDDEPAAGPRS